MRIRNRHTGEAPFSLWSLFKMYAVEVIQKIVKAVFCNSYENSVDSVIVKATGIFPAKSRETHICKLEHYRPDI